MLFIIFILLMRVVNCMLFSNCANKVHQPLSPQTGIHCRHPYDLFVHFISQYTATSPWIFHAAPYPRHPAYFQSKIERFVYVLRLISLVYPGKANYVVCLKQQMSPSTN